MLPKFVTFFSLLISNDGFLFSEIQQRPLFFHFGLDFFFLPPASSYEFNFNVIIFAILFLLQSISLYVLVDIFCTSAMHSSYIFVSSSQGHASHFPKFGRYCMRWGFLPPATKLCENAWKKLYIQVAPSIFSPCKSELNKKLSQKPPPLQVILPFISLSLINNSLKSLNSEAIAAQNSSFIWLTASGNLKNEN